ncbi:hypothetical protein SUNI508_10217 [Seiridium unicorne]|uniref:Transcription factor domain-containing protein n=1 Tax=Seiridium unicorne TaxID=138068 RepID=A0ABR2UN19_9PEZI
MAEPQRPVIFAADTRPDVTLRTIAETRVSVVRRCPNLVPWHLAMTPLSPLRHQSIMKKSSLVLERLERTVSNLVYRFDSKLGNVPNDQHASSHRSAFSPEPHSAPVLLIRDAATNAGVALPKQDFAQLNCQGDPISTGLISPSLAHSLLALFHLNYGRWVRFPEGISTETLLLRVRKSPLLLCSIFLIAVRHTNQNSAAILAPKLFHESKRLIAISLLEVPQTIEFFQAVLILSLWSTTVGQVPLSIDSWLLTGYAIQQALASPHFAATLREGDSFPVNGPQLDTWFIWNHICVAHLQYCIGTRRQSLLNQAQIDRCVRLFESDEITNYEARMVAEVKLYWIIYNKCGGPRVDLPATKMALRNWQLDCVNLFNEPRSQFLQMGFHFAHLLANCQWLKSPKSIMHSSTLKELVHHCNSIISIALNTTDERTRHLTDHIYHIITFSALTLCRIVHTYEANLRAENYDIVELDNLVFKLVNSLRSIGLPCHAARILGDIVSAQFHKLRPNFQPAPSLASYSLAEEIDFALGPEDVVAPSDLSFLYPSLIGSELFDKEFPADSWPEWAQGHSDTDM